MSAVANLAVDAAPALTVVPVWKAVDDDLRRELVDLWTRTGAIADPAIAAVRAGQAVCIARDGEDVLCGVGTAVRRVLPRLRQPMYYYRQYFAPSVRGRHQSIAFLNEARRVLQDYNAALPAPESLGVLLELENSVLAGRYDLVHHAEADSTFIGYSPRGLQLRASYFPGARLLPPVMPRRAVPLRPA